MGWNDVPATPGQIAEMQSIVRESMEEGAWGLSTGLDYEPGAYADTDELIALSETTARLGGFYHTHTRSDLREVSLLAPFEEAVEIGRRSGCPVHLTHYRQGAQGSGSHLDYIGLVEDARDEGMDVTFDCYSYPYSGTHLVISFPKWSKDGGPERLMAALSDPDDRARLKKEIPRDALENSWLTNFTRPENKAYEGRLLTDIAGIRGMDPWDTMFDLLIEENLGVSSVSLGTNQHTLAAFVSHPYGMIASDAIVFGEYPEPPDLRLLPPRACRVRPRRKTPAPAEAIRKMTSFPASDSASPTAASCVTASRPT